MALPSCGEHFGKIFPRTCFSLSASFDYRNQQTKYSTALGRAGAMAEFTSNNSMMKRLLRFIIREREHRISHDAKDSFPIIEKFSCQGASLFVKHIFIFLAALFPKAQ